MSEKIIITRGFDFKLKVPNQFCVLVLKSDENKIIINTIDLIDGKLCLISNKEATTNYLPGYYHYQLLDNIGIVYSGDAEVKQNYLLVDQEKSVKSRDQIVLQAIEAQLAGVASNAQQSISVGDKSISYMSITELLKLRQYFKNKVDKEQGNRSKDDGGKIRYKWSIR